MADKSSSSGFTFVEVLVVIIVLLILAAAAVANLAISRRTLSTNNAASTMFSLLQLARQRAIANRQPQRVTITRTPDANNRINLVRIEGLDVLTNTPVLFREEYLPQDVVLARPAEALLVGTPRSIPAEAAFDAALPNGKLVMLYDVDGSITDTNGNPFTGSIFFSQAQNGGSLALTRALSVYSSTGDVKYWFYNGTNAFVAGARNF